MSFRQIFERDIRDLKDWAKQVWMLPSLEDKKVIALDMVNNFQFRTKSADFINKINSSKSPNALDKLVGDIVLAGEGLAVGSRR